MNCRFYRNIFFFLFFFLLTPVYAKDMAKNRDWLASLQQKEKITLVITDSGLGGLSVVADAEQKMAFRHIYKDVELIFVNALFSNEGGYNSLPSRKRKLEIFSSVLQSIETNYHPDLIMVACNTLSVLYKDTAFAQRTKTPVVGIVEDGVEQIAEKLLADPEAKNIIFATQTTISEESHKQGLVGKGVKEQQIYTQPCPELTLYIEQGFDSMETELLIDAYVDEALTNAGVVDSPLYCSFNCTHFGYALDAWKKAFASRGVAVAGFLNPNTKMVDFLLPENLWNRFPVTTVKVQVVSMTDITENRRDSIGRYLDTISKKTAAALRSFNHQENLFQWKH